MFTTISFPRLTFLLQLTAKFLAVLQPTVTPLKPSGNTSPFFVPVLHHVNGGLQNITVIRRRIRWRGSQPTSSFNFMSYLKFFQKQRASYYSNGNIKDSYILKWFLAYLSSSVTKKSRVWEPLISYPDPTV